MTTRRHLLAGAGIAGLGAAAGAGTVAGIRDHGAPARAAGTTALDTGSATVAFHGPRQAGVSEDPPAHAAFVAFTLAPSTDRRVLARMMRLLSDDAARLTQGTPALGDTDATLAMLPARLTVTFGFGPGLYRAAGVASPVADLPPFRIDRLERRWSGGDLILADLRRRPAHRRAHPADADQGRPAVRRDPVGPAGFPAQPRRAGTRAYPA